MIYGGVSERLLVVSEAWFGQLNKQSRLKPGHLAYMPAGTEFFSRAEMETVGFHAKQMNGIDYW